MPTFRSGRGFRLLPLAERQGAEPGDVFRDHGAGLPQGHRRVAAHVFDARPLERGILALLSKEKNKICLQQHEGSARLQIIIGVTRYLRRWRLGAVLTLRGIGSRGLKRRETIYIKNNEETLGSS